MTCRSLGVAMILLTTGHCLAAEGWKCSAPGLIAARYEGGATAYVHLSGFAYGGNYKVKKSGDKATGVTANGTKFTCRRT